MWPGMVLLHHTSMCWWFWKHGPNDVSPVHLNGMETGILLFIFPLRLKILKKKKRVLYLARAPPSLSLIFRQCKTSWSFSLRMPNVLITWRKHPYSYDTGHFMSFVLVTFLPFLFMPVPLWDICIPCQHTDITYTYSYTWYTKKITQKKRLSDTYTAQIYWYKHTDVNIKIHQNSQIHTVVHIHLVIPTRTYTYNIKATAVLSYSMKFKK